MRILIAIIMICAACFVLFISLLSVVRDLLVITTGYGPSESHSHATNREESAICRNGGVRSYE